MYKNQIFKQNELQNQKILKTGSTQTHSKFERKLTWVFQKLLKLAWFVCIKTKLAWVFQKFLNIFKLAWASLRFYKIPN